VREPRSSVVSLDLFPASRGLSTDVVSLAVGFGDAAIWIRGFEERLLPVLRLHRIHLSFLHLTELALDWVCWFCFYATAIQTTYLWFMLEWPVAFG